MPKLVYQMCETLRLSIGLTQACLCTLYLVSSPNKKKVVLWYDVHMCVWVCVRVHACMCVCLYIVRVCVCLCVFVREWMCAWLYECVCMYVCEGVNVCLCVYVWECVCMCVYVCVSVCVWVSTPCRHIHNMRLSSTHSKPQHHINISDQLHTPAPLPPGKNPRTLIRTKYEAGWAPEEVWTFLRREKYCSYDDLDHRPSMPYPQSV